jgi:hypothetical protein
MPLTAANIQRRYSLPLLTAQARRIGLPLALAKMLSPGGLLSSQWVQVATIQSQDLI